MILDNKSSKYDRNFDWITCAHMSLLGKLLLLLSLLLIIAIIIIAIISNILAYNSACVAIPVRI